MIHLSVVTSLYRSESTIRDFYEQVRDVLGTIRGEHEIVFVDDGSPDRCSEVVKDLMSRDTGIVLIQLSRNFGHAAAMYTGIEQARGQYVFVIDSDLEEKPDWLAQFHRLMLSDSADVVYGYMETRKGSLSERLLGACFYRLINILSDVPIPINQVWARLMTRRYVNSLLQYKETDFYFAGMFQLAGYKQVGVPVLKTSKGSTSYSFLKRLQQALNAVTSFSVKPLIWMSVFGLIVAAFGFFLGVYLVVRKLFFGGVLAGWTSVMSSLWLLGGLIIASIGLVGIYTARTFIQAKARPRAVIKEKLPDGNR